MATHETHAAAARDPFRFEDQVVFVAGLGGTFGRAAALGFAALGARIYGVDVHETAMQATIGAVRTSGGIAEGMVADTGDASAVATAFEGLDSTFGRIDVLLNLSGANVPVGPPEAVDVVAWNALLRTNLTSKVLTAGAAASRMIAAGRGGSIVNVSSIAGSSVLGRDSLAYGVAMAGTIQLTRELAIAWAPHGIRVNAIQPCQFVNPGLQAMIDDPARAAIVRRMIAGIPLGRMGVAAEIVGPLVFLASPAAAMVTGITMPVDGGNLAFNAGGSLRSS